MKRKKEARSVCVRVRVRNEARAGRRALHTPHKTHSLNIDKKTTQTAYGEDNANHAKSSVFMERGNVDVIGCRCAWFDMNLESVCVK